MKQALEDLGIEQSELREKPLTKKTYLDKLKKQHDHKIEVEADFEKKYGIMNLKEASEIELINKKESITQKLDDITDEERKILQHNKIRYDGSVDYEEHQEENMMTHLEETYHRLDNRVKEMEKEGIIKKDATELLKEHKEVEDMHYEMKYLQNEYKIEGEQIDKMRDR